MYVWQTSDGTPAGERTTRAGPDLGRMNLAKAGAISRIRAGRDDSENARLAPVLTGSPVVADCAHLDTGL
jgi:hypothetical protein